MTPPPQGLYGDIAIQSVLRVGTYVNGTFRSFGTGFMHSSGKVITAAHVVRNLNRSDVAVVGGSLTVPVMSSNVAIDPEHDLALLTPASGLSLPGLFLGGTGSFDIGGLVTTWGYPEGYADQVPILSVGHLAGFRQAATPTGKTFQEFVINAAFNSGNSGGPLLYITPPDHVAVIGVVVSKLAPVPSHIDDILKALSNQTSGFMYTVTTSPGQTSSYSEGQLIAEVLNYLRRQIQLVVGHAVPVVHLRNFLTAQQITP